MSDIAKSVIQLKNDIENLEKLYETKYKAAEERENNLKKLELKYNDIKTLQNNIIEFNVGGELLTTNRSLIVNSIYNNILKDTLTNLIKLNRPYTDCNKIFIDRNPNSFKYILEILRKTYESYVNNEFNLDLIKGVEILIDFADTDIDSLVEDVKYYFKSSDSKEHEESDAEKVLEAVNFSYMSNGKMSHILGQFSYEHTKSFTDLPIINVTVKAPFPSTELDPYRATTYADISKVNSAKAYFVSYETTITFELGSEKEISEIEIRPFTTNLQYWVPCEGIGSYIYTSTVDSDNNYEFAGTVSEDYGCDFTEGSKKTYKISFGKRKVRYIKFQTGDYTLSISYLKIK